MRPVYPITPSFINDELDLETTLKYIKYLGDNTLMTTAGTTQFNLLSSDEIRKVNDLVINNSMQIPIIGIPALSLRDAIKELEYYNTKKCYPMILYPERFYTEDNVCEFFEELADKSTNPIYIHGMWVRKGNGGNWDFTSSVINRLSKHPNIMGMKEETSSIDLAYKVMCGVTEDFDIIVAGGSMRRHHFLSLAKDNLSFLTGIGSIYPNLPNDYLDNNNSNIIKELENKLFNVFMNIGWHASFRYALHIKGFVKENRKPFINLCESDKQKIHKVISQIEKLI